MKLFRIVYEEPVANTPDAGWAKRRVVLEGDLDADLSVNVDTVLKESLEYRLRQMAAAPVEGGTGDEPFVIVHRGTVDVWQKTAAEALERIGGQA